MSHDQGLSPARHTPSAKLHGQPALDRPSLFAGMEADEDDVPERVRILSTLAANRPPSKRASTRSSSPRGHDRSGWQFKALLTLMGLGVVGLLAGFAMVLADGHPELGSEDGVEPAQVAVPAVKPTVVAATASAATVAASQAITMAVTASTPDTSPASSPASQPLQAAVIEDIAPAAVTTLGTTAASPLAALSAPPARIEKPAPQPVQTARTVRTAPRQPQQRATQAKRSQDADVAVLEAMFTHSKPSREAKSTPAVCAQQPQAPGCTASR